MTSERRVDPELEGLLREIAADPRATMLKVPVERAASTVFERDVLLPRGTTGITVGERELLRAHREDVAYLLRVACASLLITSKEGSRRAIRTVRGNERIDPVPPALLRRQLEQARDASDGSDPDVLEILQDIVAPDRRELPSVAQLAAASMRLVPTDQARTYQALYEGHVGNVQTALRIHSYVATHATSSLAAATSWNNAAFLQALDGARTQALESCRRAVTVDPSLPMAAFSLLRLGLVLGCTSDVVRAARSLDSHLTRTSPQFAELSNHSAHVRIDANDADRARDSWTRTEREMGLVSKELTRALF